MKKYLALALLAFAFSGSSTETKAWVAIPKACVPVLRVPPASYVPNPAMLSPPQPVPYSVWYYNLSDAWACAPVGVQPVVAVRAGF